MDIFTAPEPLVFGLCGGCGSVTKHLTEIEVAGSGSVAAFRQCESCFDKSYEGFLDMKRQFQFLVDNGVPPERADQIMCRRISEMEKKIDE